MLAVATGSTFPFRWMNSALTGAENNVTVFPDWLVSVKFPSATGN